MRDGSDTVDMYLAMWKETDPTRRAAPSRTNRAKIFITSVRK
jgi:hypothetical protein